MHVLEAMLEGIANFSCAAFDFRPPVAHPGDGDEGLFGGAIHHELRGVTLSRHASNLLPVRSFVDRSHHFISKTALAHRPLKPFLLPHH